MTAILTTACEWSVHIMVEAWVSYNGQHSFENNIFYMKQIFIRLENTMLFWVEFDVLIQYCCFLGFFCSNYVILSLTKEMYKCNYLRKLIQFSNNEKEDRDIFFIKTGENKIMNKVSKNSRINLANTRLDFLDS